MSFAEICHSIEDGDWIEKKDQSNSGIRLIQTGNIGVGVYKDKTDKAKYISEDTFVRLKCLEVVEGDILISRLPEPVGRACAVPKLPVRSITAVDCSILKLKNCVAKSWFIYYTQSNDYFSKARKECSGTTRDRITRKKLSVITIPVPPLSEQQRIVALLDAEFAKIDALKANAEKNLQNAKDLFQAALKKELEPKEGWKKTTLQEICSHIVDCPHTTPIKSLSKTDYPCIRTSELKNGEIYWETMQYVEESEYVKRVSRLIPQENDIVYGREGTFGDAVLIPDYNHFCLGQRTMLFRPNQKIVMPRFLLLYVISPYVYDQAKAKNTGCGVGHVNVRDIKEFSVNLPQIYDQQAIVSRLDTLNEKCKALQANYEKTLSLCDDLKQALLRKAFNGEI